MGNGYKTFAKKLDAQIKKRIKELNMTEEEFVKRLNTPFTEEQRKRADEMLKEFGKELREAREEKGWSVEELSKRAKVPMASIQLIEAGVGHHESAETLFLISKQLKGTSKLVPKEKGKKLSGTAKTKRG